MTISEMIEQLQAAKRALGDVDVVHILNDQPADILEVTACREAQTMASRAFWSGPVAVITLQKD